MKTLNQKLIFLFIMGLMFSLPTAFADDVEEVETETVVEEKSEITSSADEDSDDESDYIISSDD